MEDIPEKKLEELFEAALDYEPTERSDFLDKACGKDENLRARVESLLAADEQAHDFLESPLNVTPLFEAAEDPQDSMSGKEIGQYRILRFIASGGMGTVYEAMQKQPRRHVALKILKADLASPSIMRRFAHEAEILGRLRHPGIAQIYEAGIEEKEGGLPYFAMEFIPEAKSITQYAEDKGLSFQERLELFGQVCDAIHHGHQHGVIHRDVKPSNILVDETGLLKVIDFGVARVTDADMTIATQQTDAGQLVGTLKYMSPEQCCGDSAQIDIRCDVYALGVVLYELITGQLPYDLTTPSPFDVPRVIREVEPRKLTSINRSYPHDVETIILKALDKDRGRRYQSALEMGQDIHRYLNNEPIEAKRDHPWYMLKKTLSRYRLAVGVSASFFLFLMICAVALGILYKRADTNRMLAENRAEVLRINDYFNTMALAQNAYDSANTPQQKELLKRCPPDLRGWEWFYLSSLSDQSIETLSGHEGSVLDIALSPDGNRIVSGGRDDHTVRIWDSNTGALIHTCTGHKSRVSCVAFSPDGKRIVSGSYDTFLKIWDTATGQMLDELAGDGSVVTRVTFSPSGEHLLSGHEEEEGAVVKVWNAFTGDLIQEWIGHRHYITAMAVSEDEKIFATGGDDQFIKLWKGLSGEELQSIHAHGNRISCLAFSADGTELYSASWDKQIKVWDVESGELLETLLKHDTSVFDMSLDSDKKKLAYSGATTVDILDIEAPKLLRRLLGHERNIYAVRFFPDSRRVASCSLDGSIKIWDTVHNEAYTILGSFKGKVDSLACSGDGRWIATTGGVGVIKIYDGRTLSEYTAFKGCEDGVTSLAISPDSSLLVFGGIDHVARVWDIENKEEKCALKEHTLPVIAVAWSSDGSLIATGSWDSRIVLWSADSFEPMKTLTCGNAVFSVNFSPDGKRLISGERDGKICIWNVISGEMIDTLEGHTDTIRKVVYSPDGNLIVSGSDDWTLKIWNALDNQVIHSCKGHRQRVLDVAFSPEMNRIVSASADCTLKVWDSDTGKLALTLRDHDDTVECVVFLPDGEGIVSGSNDKTVRIWNAGSELR